MNLRHFILGNIIKIMQKLLSKKVNVLGKEYVVSNNVFNPKYFITSELMAQLLDVKEKEVLDVGCGSGILAIEAANKAKMVVATDINGEAVELARKNAIRNSASGIIFIQCDLFSCLRKKFDVILFNPPYLEGKVKSSFDMAIFDTDKKLIERFFMEADNYLKENGYIMLAYSAVANVKKMLKIAQKYGWKYEIIGAKKLQFEKIFIFKMLKVYKPQPL